MIVNKEQIEKIKKTLDFMISEYEEFADYADELEIKNEDLQDLVDSDYELPAFSFPGEYDSIEISVEEFLKIADEIPTIELLTNSVVKTKTRRYYIVEPTDSNQQYVIRNFHNLKVRINDEMSIDLVSENFLVGLAATKTGEYDRDYFGTVTPYDAIEIIYTNPNKVLAPEK